MHKILPPVYTPGLPKKPYTPEKPKGDKAMTIVAGFPYQDGLLICADTQITDGNGLKCPDHKVFPLDIEGARCVFAFADRVGLANEIRGKIAVELLETVQSSPSELSTADFVKVVEKITDNYGRIYQPLSLEFVLGCYPSTESRPSLIHFDGQSVTTGQTQIVLLGCGRNPLTKYLSNHLYKSDQMPRLYAIAVGSYLVKKATQLVDGCAEPIEGFVLTRDGLQNADKWLASTLQATEAQENELFKLLIEEPWSFLA